MQTRLCMPSTESASVACVDTGREGQWPMSALRAWRRDVISGNRNAGQHLGLPRRLCSSDWWLSCHPGAYISPASTASSPPMPSQGHRHASASHSDIHSPTMSWRQTQTSATGLGNGASAHLWRRRLDVSLRGPPHCPGHHHRQGYGTHHSSRHGPGWRPFTAYCIPVTTTAVSVVVTPRLAVSPAREGTSPLSALKIASLLPFPGIPLPNHRLKRRPPNVGWLWTGLWFRSCRVEAGVHTFRLSESSPRNESVA